MSFTAEELESKPSLLTTAKHLADMVTHDVTVGGIFPNAGSGDFSSPNVERFKSKFCSWWPLAKRMLGLAKVFTGDRIDAVIDKLITLGDQACG